ncbi:hypothetical protein CsSME_00045899 [Camellia sinensis var. sinensis]
MGQSLKKLAPGSEENKAKEIGPAPISMSIGTGGQMTSTMPEINKTLGSTQFRVPKTTELEQVFKDIL